RSPFGCFLRPAVEPTFVRLRRKHRTRSVTHRGVWFVVFPRGHRVPIRGAEITPAPLISKAGGGRNLPDPRRSAAARREDSEAGRDSAPARTPAQAGQRAGSTWELKRQTVCEGSRSSRKREVL